MVGFFTYNMYRDVYQATKSENKELLFSDTFNPLIKTSRDLDYLIQSIVTRKDD